MKDTVEALNKSITERTSSPFILSLLTSWVVYNHKLIMILLTPEWGVEEKFTNMEPLINWANMFGWPLSGSLFFLWLWAMRVPYHAAWDWISTIVKTNKEKIENAKGVAALKGELETASKVVASFVDIVTVDLPTIRSFLSEFEKYPNHTFKVITDTDNRTALELTNGQVIFKESQDQKDSVEKTLWMLKHLGIVAYNPNSYDYKLLKSRHSNFTIEAIQSVHQKSIDDLP